MECCWVLKEEEGKGCFEAATLLGLDSDIRECSLARHLSYRSVSVCMTCTDSAIPCAIALT